jgi:recombination protein RecA
MERTKKPESLSVQMKRKVNASATKANENEGNFETMISTGSTLLDLAISGGKVHGGGIPGGILVEAFGPESSGKSVFLSQVAGNVQKAGGSVMFHDPEARLNPTFAKMFGLDLDMKDYGTPDTVTEVFSAVRKWSPEGKGINGIFADSLAALSTNMEMDNEEGDKMGGRRAKEFSEQLRKTCRLLRQKNYLMVCSNQIRENMGAIMFEPKITAPGGKAMGFYSSLRLRFGNPIKLKEDITFRGKKITRVRGVTTEIEVHKSSIWKPFHSAPVTIIFDYGIDDIRQNLQFLKTYTGATTYCIDERKLGQKLEEAIKTVETQNLEFELREAVIELWERIESKFESNRKPRV